MEFAMLFQPHYLKRQTDDEANADNEFYIEEDDADSPLVRLFEKTKMRKKTWPPKVRVPYFRAAPDPDNFYYSLLLQYMPYRNEAEILENFDSAKDAFLSKEEQLKG